MESGISMLNKIKEVQNRTLSLKKVYTGIYDETTIKVKDVTYYNEQIKSQKPILIERKEVRAQLESENCILDRNIAAWKAILDDKKQYLQKEKEEVEQLKRNIFLARISYCDYVSRFLNENISLEKEFSSLEDTELKTLRAEAAKLEQDLNTLDKTIRDKKSAEFRRLLGQKMRAEEIRCQKLLEDKKSKLRRLVKEIRTKKQKNFVEMTAVTVSNVTHESLTYSVPTSLQDHIYSKKEVYQWPTQMTQSSDYAENKESSRSNPSYYTDLVKKYSNSIGQQNKFVTYSVRPLKRPALSEY